jgi:SHS2 domain-containing protein
LRPNLDVVVEVCEWAGRPARLRTLGVIKGSVRGRPALVGQLRSAKTAAMEAAIERGHRLVRHIADVTIEAWGPSREICLAEAVAALVDSFADCTDVASTDTVPVSFPVAADGQLLVTVLEEVIYLLDVLGSVVVSAALSDTEDGGIAGFFELADVAKITMIGPTPKGISRKGLALGCDGGGWAAYATVDA